MNFKRFYPAPLYGRRGVAALLLRLLVGTAFVIHGNGKVADVGGFAAEFQMPLAVALAAAYAQLLAGVLLIIGFATPLASVTIAGTMVVATLKLIGRGEPYISPHSHSYEASFFYLVLSIALALWGPDGYSIDAYFLSKRSGAQLRHLLEGRSKIIQWN